VAGSSSDNCDDGDHSQHTIYELLPSCLEGFIDVHGIMV